MTTSAADPYRVTRHLIVPRIHCAEWGDRNDPRHRRLTGRREPLVDSIFDRGARSL
jgi:hypothetical protein